MSNLHIKTVSSIQEIEPSAWDKLSRESPFQSHRWYRYGECVMEDCTPVYLLAYDGGELVGRAALWLVHNEPLPKMLGPLRKPATAMVKKWPLLICRSPLSYASGLVIASSVDREEVLSALAETALVEARGHSASFVLFDYLAKRDAQGWPSPFSGMSAPNPGMQMENHWSSLDDYLASVGKKDRQHYKRTLREAGKLGIRIECHSHPGCIQEALPIIRNVEASHGALPNPWAGAMLEHMDMVDGAFLTAVINDQLVGCGLLSEDNHTQMTSLLGLAEDIPYVYFMLVYESLNLAFQHKVRLLRWGSGAYDVKQRLGFSLEDNGSLTFTAVHPTLQKIVRWAS